MQALQAKVRRLERITAFFVILSISLVFYLLTFVDLQFSSSSLSLGTHSDVQVKEDTFCNPGSPSDSPTNNKTLPVVIHNTTSNGTPKTNRTMTLEEMLDTLYSIEHYSCSLTSVPHYAFDTKTLNDSYSGTCTDKHTHWDRKNQTITMNCSPGETAFYRSETYVFDDKNDKKRWRLYEGPVNTNAMDMIQTACVSRIGSRHNYYVQSIRDEALVNSRGQVRDKFVEKNNGTRPVNLHVLVLDACAREYFQRHFPHTIQYLDELKAKKDLPFSILEFPKYHVLNFNSDPNMYTFTAGGNIDPNFKAYERYVLKVHSGKTQRVEKFVWQWMHDMGYISTVGEDVVSSRTGMLYGCRKKAQSFDTFPAFHSAIASVVEDQKYTYHYKWDRCPCLGNRFASELMFEFVQSQSTVYKDFPNFVMTVNDETHDEACKQCVTLDPSLRDHLRWYVESGQLNNTVLLLMSDHGLHYGHPFHSDRKRAEKEHQYPLLTIFAPNHITTRALVANQDKLISLRDLHVTLLDMASFPNRITAENVKDYSSLIHDFIPANRTCEDMKVAPKYATYCPKN